MRYYRYPNIFRGGLTFRPRTDPRTVFTIEAGIHALERDRATASMSWPRMNPQNLDKTWTSASVWSTRSTTGCPCGSVSATSTAMPTGTPVRRIFTGGNGHSLSAAGCCPFRWRLSKITSVQEHQFPYPAGLLRRSPGSGRRHPVPGRLGLHGQLVAMPPPGSGGRLDGRCSGRK